jgi:hypothetical protein
MNRLLQQSMFVDYTWACMRPVTVPSTADTSGFTLDRRPEVKVTEDSDSDVVTVDSGVSDDMDVVDLQPPPKVNYIC